MTKTSKSSNWKEHVWNILKILLLLLSGTRAKILVTLSPSVLVSKLAQNVTLPCNFTYSSEHTVKKDPILYWRYLNQTEKPKLWPKDPQYPQYKDRVEVLDSDQNSSNKSILLKNVQWEDVGIYQCKVSYEETEQKPNRTHGWVLLLVYGSATCDLIPEFEGTHRCAVNVSWDPGSILTMTQSDNATKNIHSFQGNTLSVVLSSKSAGDYECQLNLNSTVIQSWTCPQTVVMETQVEKELPQPWLLLTAILLVPITVLLVLLTACVLIFKCNWRG